MDSTPCRPGFPVWTPPFRVPNFSLPRKFPALPGTIDSRESLNTRPISTIPISNERPSTHLKASSNKRKRQHGAKPGENSCGIKKQKLIGRPRNSWTKSRLRKLVRLYLMTDLSVQDIAIVLRAKDFSPSKRDTQKQIKWHFPGRDPRQFRDQWNMPKIRLQLARECRAKKSARSTSLLRERKSRSPMDDELTSFHESDGTYGQGLNPELLNLPGSIDESLPSEASTDANDISLEKCTFTDYNIRMVEEASNVRPSISDTTSDGCSPSISKIPSLVSSHASTRSTGSSSHANGSPSPEHLDHSEKSLSMIDVAESADTILKPDLETGQQETVPATTATPLSLPNLRFFPAAEKHPASIPESHELSIHSIGGLRRRLPGKTDSVLGDVWSAFQNLTISGASTRSHTSWAGRVVSTISTSVSGLSHSDRHLHDVDENEESTFTPLGIEPRLPLPGDFAADSLYKAYYIGQRRYRRKWGEFEKRPRILKDSHSVRSIAKLVLSIHTHTLEVQLLDPQRKDLFGNTALHIAAALQRLAMFHPLIRHGVNVHAENSANETLLHLVDDFDEYEYSILSTLKTAEYDFNQRNCLGQTALHQLMQGWMGELRLRGILAALAIFKIPLPSSRDSFGNTIMSQLEEAGIDKYTIRISLSERDDRPQKETWDLTEMAGLQRPRVPENQTAPVMPNYGDQVSITTMEELCLYDHHRALLKTIVKAYSSPRHEDNDGRNGLHCLAEVSLTLPIQCEIPNYATACDGLAFRTRREGLLYGLVHVGVDPDNHDKEGLTPLMAFIIHTRDGEDEDATERLLSQLCEAGVNVNRRNRSGETPLHMAVKLGKRTVTKFLLENKANVHARDISGTGIIASGLEQSRKSTDGALLAQILLCVDLVKKAGGVASPTFYQEWAVDESGSNSKARRRISLPRLALRT
ncbi:ankyrin [Mollisia scopiformis]|uniref:Ankyrin n=1 Tax=Mollisia scopiformis TaxID=149040 RepID=A0A194WRK6_MOLSC|nr:ankyrin [Mollisia scopiformis]KUJ10636.1 ankyrin [Mollisia scopiformis]